MITDQKLYAGASWDFTDSFTDFPASEFDCVLYLKLGTNQTITTTPTKDGDDFVFTKTAERTAAITPGLYDYQYVFTSIADSSDVHVESGQVQIDALLNAEGDIRTEDRKVLDELIAARLRVAKREYVSITVNGKATQFKTLHQIDAEIVKCKKRLGIFQENRMVFGF